MIVFKLMGGLGNQMFQYALAKHYQLKGEEVFLDVSSYRGSNQNIISRNFELPNLLITIPTLPKVSDRFFNSTNLFWRIVRKIPFSSFNRVTEKNLAYNNSFLNLKGNSIITGYFQSEKYFKDFEEKLRQDFRFRSLSARNTQYSEAIRESNAISLHIRRGDYVTDSLTNKIHGVLPLAYYQAAVQTISKEVGNPSYFVFTDDPVWAHQNVSSILDNFTIVEGNMENGNSWEDMCLISHCKHNIVANSSFSWWGAWLNANHEKKIIAPENWCLDEELNAQTRHLVPLSWIRIRNT